VTPEDVDRVVATAAQVHDDTALSAAFYRVLFERHPELRPLFPADMSHQLHRFVAELEALARTLPDLSGFEQRAHELGERHVHYGVRAEYYPMVREALLDGLAEHLAPGFGPDDRLAWARAFNLLSEIMLEGAEPVRTTPD
jgi:hemoglobin-like flavoprotein